MSRRIVWEDVSIRIYIDGDEAAGQFFCSSISIDETLNVDKAKVQGSSTPNLDATYDGARGSFEFLLVDGYGDPRRLFEVQKEAIKSRTPGARIRAVVARRIPGSTQREALRIDGMIVQPSDRVGEGQRWSQSWSFDAENVKPIAA